VARLVRSRGMSRIGCVDGPGIESSGEGGADGSRCGRGGGCSGFGGGEVIKAEGKGVGVKTVVPFAEIDGGVGGGTMSIVRREFLDDGFRC